MPNLKKAEATISTSNEIDMEDVTDITREEARRAIRGIPQEVAESMIRHRKQNIEQVREFDF